MLLTELIDGITIVKLFSMFYGKMAMTQDIAINGIRYDSRKVGPRDVFVAIRGGSFDGHKFILDAISQGATVIVVEDDNVAPDPLCLHNEVFKIVVSDSRQALARLSANFYRHPSRKLKLVGVTGTNGKTTTTHLLRSVLETAGQRTGLIGTIGYSTGADVRPATHTTPESLELQALFAEMVKAGCTAAAMEVSSHSLAQGRVAGLEFAGATFTNLTQDHLDFHKTMEHYLQSKKILFDGLSAESIAVTNADDPYGKQIVADTKAKVVTYSSVDNADVVAKNIRVGYDGISMSIAHAGHLYPLSSPLTGDFNVENILAAFTTGIALDLSPDAVVQGVASQHAVRGRFERINAPDGWIAIIDYAHTPDALQKSLQTLRRLINSEAGGRIITVFGCGGDRDKGKRPLMGRIAATASDLTVVTSDNPRTENPETIIDEVLAGIPAGARVERVSDRKQAIHMALNAARKGDIVLLAGKGHEDYQVIGTEKVHLDDREEVERFIARGKSRQENQS